MGSVISDRECPNCKHEHAYEDYYYKCGDVYIYCHRCGFNFHGNEHDKNWNKKMERQIKKAIGGFRIMFDGGGTSGSFKTKKQARQFEEDARQGFRNQAGEKASEVIYTFFDKESKTWFAKDLIHNVIISFDEYERKQRHEEEND